MSSSFSLTPTTLRQRSRSDQTSLLPTHAPRETSSSPLKSCGLLVASLLIFGTVGSFAVSSLLTAGGGVVAAAEVATTATANMQQTVQQQAVQQQDARAAAPTRSAPVVAPDNNMKTTGPTRAVGDDPGADAGIPCVDKASRCAEWAKQGECQRNPPFMSRECRASCGHCQATGDDAKPKDDERASASKPSSSPPTRITAQNEQELRCHAWALQGECEKNEQYMLSKCRNACEHHHAAQGKTKGE